MEFVMIFSRNKSKLDNGIIINVVPYQLLLRWVISKKKAWCRRLILAKQVVGNLEDKISNSPTPISIGYDAGRCLPFSPQNRISYVRLARIRLHFPCLSICYRKDNDICGKCKTSFPFGSCCRCCKVPANKILIQESDKWKHNFVYRMLG